MLSTQKRPAAIIALVILVGSLLLNACNMPGRNTPTQSAVGAIYTAAAETVQAQLTEVSQPPATPGPGTLVPPTQPVATAINTLAPTSPGETSIPATTAVAGACDQVRFIKDITVPDGTELAPGTTFVKTWQLENAGTCTWTSAYSVVFDSGDQMEAPASTPLTTAPIAPGAKVDVSVTMKAPDTVGSYQANFKLSNADNQRFGTDTSNKPFWAQIDVVAATGNTMDFLVRATEASWTSGVGDNPPTALAFNGAEDDPNGVATIKDGVKLENGATSGKILLTVPKRDPDGVITGFYPAYQVQPGDHLKARLGFMTNPGGGCGSGNVNFQVFYKEGDSIHLLDQWGKSCDGRLLPIDIDLSTLNGKTVQFALVAHANNTAQDNWAIWNSPLIKHQ